MGRVSKSEAVDADVEASGADNQKTKQYESYGSAVHLVTTIVRTSQTSPRTVHAVDRILSADSRAHRSITTMYIHHSIDLID
ncbi:hypothetical protein SCLCIDRAFT_1219155 [Scleroderma citrinum Foug A]|uniref:Uncharacterized protein n=1 Tax=Scleroderma citrinum Foug A TaxID=1036808 RepID=A0A0C3DAL4_9AGAM|nr:hypothetical protein SCLCIDRAFT_1219155 [Scleroderma citrinum Foug A]